MRLIDSHLHFWDQSREDLSYPWLRPGVPHPIIGNIEPIKSPVYDVDAYIAEARFAGVEKAVHVEAAAEADSPTIETDWVRSLENPGILPIAIVAHVDLGAEFAPSEILQLVERPGVRGVRDFGVVNYLEDPKAAPNFEPNLKAMEDAGLLLDLDCSWEYMALAKDMADAHPQLRIVLEHIGYPRRRDNAYFQEWEPAVRHLAQAQNVHCKLSGLGMTDRSWTVASLRRWVTTCLEAFGPGRCLYGSNWPVDRIASSYDAVVAAFLEMISGHPASEQEAMCSTNAEALYFA
jgi:predicted TIM-barrel fold metal-dependent hydrolase